MKSPKVFLIPLATVSLFALPSELLKRFIARVAGLLFYTIDKTRRQAIVSNFRLILEPENQNSSLITHRVRRTFENFALSTIDFLQIPKGRRIWLRAIVKSRGREHIDHGLALGRGVILVSAHFGNVELACACLASMGYPVVLVSEEVKGGHTDTLARYRRWAGIDVIMMDEPRRMVKALKNNKLLILAGDRDLTGTGIEFPFFRGQRSFPRGPATLALKSGAVLLVGYFVLNPESGKQPYLGVIEPPVSYQPIGNRDEDVKRFTKIITEAIERVIRMYPDQWCVFQPDWR